MRSYPGAAPSNRFWANSLILRTLVLDTILGPKAPSRQAPLSGNFHGVKSWEGEALPMPELDSAKVDLLKCHQGNEPQQPTPQTTRMYLSPAEGAGGRPLRVAC